MARERNTTSGVHGATRRRDRRMASWVLGCGVAIAAVALAAQQPLDSAPPSQQAATFRAGIDAVTVDAIVTDKQGRPVADLKPEDFEIFENKKPQAIQTFKLIKIDVDALDPTYTRDVQSIDDQTREAARDDIRLIVVFLDDYHTRLGNSMSIRTEVARFISGLGPHDLVAVMYPLTPVAAMTFSRNHEATAAAIMGFMGRKYNYVPKNEYEQQYAEYPPETQELFRRQVVITGLEATARYLGTLKDGKKQILFVSEGLVGSVPQGVSIQTINPQRLPTAPLTQAQRFQESLAALHEMDRVFTACSRSNTAIFTLDPRGLAVSEFQINDNVGHDDDKQMLQESQDSLRILAESTDGRAIVNRNQPLPELKKMVNEMSAYYLLGYTSTEAPRDGKFHEIQVRMKRKDLEVRHRRGYWAYTAEDAARATAAPREGPPAAVEDALGTLATSRDHVMRSWVATRRGEEGKTAVTFVWEALPSRNLPLRGGNPDAVAKLTLIATSIQGDVLYRGEVARDPQATSPSGAIQFDSPPGAVRLQMTAENATGQRIDSDEKTVDVPDFTKVGTTITTPVVYRGRTARDIQQFRAAGTPLPTAAREFTRLERLLIRFQAYAPADVAPAISMRLLNSLGKPMAALPAPTRLPDGTFESELGLGPLAPGDYVIEINADAPGADKVQMMLPLRIVGS
jgi:VWFA-related protein